MKKLILFSSTGVDLVEVVNELIERVEAMEKIMFETQPTISETDLSETSWPSSTQTHIVESLTAKKDGTNILITVGTEPDPSMGRKAYQLYLTKHQAEDFANIILSEAKNAGN